VVDGQKMSKSKGNFYTLRDLLDRGYDPAAIRQLLLSTHYRKPLNFTLEGIRNAAAALETLQNFVRLVRACRTAPTDSARIGQIVDAALQRFESAMDDNLNISAALGAVFDARYDLNSLAESQGLSEADRERILFAFHKFNLLLDTLDLEAEEIADAEIQRLIDARAEARRNREFKRADAIRDELLLRGIALEDTRDGVRWKRMDR
jgi:cysteinyl-tRNA synthetase